MPREHVVQIEQDGHMLLYRKRTESNALYRTVCTFRIGLQQSAVVTESSESYQKSMRGVDVADKLQGYYNIQQPTHKWWHRVLFFLLDMSLVNSFLLYEAYMRERSTKSLSHLKTPSPSRCVLSDVLSCRGPKLDSLAGHTNQQNFPEACLWGCGIVSGRMLCPMTLNLNVAVPPSFVAMTL